jgi:sec-independent protein translocase protein TatB
VFNISGTEIVVILLLALVVLGPEKLPDAMRRAGRTYAELKRMSSSFQDEMRSALDEPMKEMRDTADLLRNAATFDPKVAATRAVKQAATKPAPAAPSEPAEPAGPSEGIEPELDHGPATSSAPDDDLIARTLSGGAAPSTAEPTPPPAADNADAAPAADPLADETDAADVGDDDRDGTTPA